MILIGLTGGIGSGKSTVSSLLARHGAIIIDADQITRDLQCPGAPLLDAIVSEFGADVLDPDGSLNRAKLAGRVFGDTEALKKLNAIVHPAVGKEMSRRLDEQKTTNNVVVLDIPLLVENPRKGLSGTVVVDLPVDIAVQRLVEHRGMSRDDAEARISRQASREDRLAIADRVIDNSGTPADLQAQVDDVWKWAVALPPADPDAGKPVRT
jgi:dephospho-CoA kinase